MTRVFRRTPRRGQVPPGPTKVGRPSIKDEGDVGEEKKGGTNCTKRTPQWLIRQKQNNNDNNNI